MIPGTKVRIVGRTFPFHEYQPGTVCTVVGASPYGTGRLWLRGDIDGEDRLQIVDPADFEEVADA